MQINLKNISREKLENILEIKKRCLCDNEEEYDYLQRTYGTDSYMTIAKYQDVERNKKEIELIENELNSKVLLRTR